MPVHHLTDRTIAALPVPSESERQRDYWDDKLRGFGVRVSYGGKRAFVVRYRVGRRMRRLTIGPYGPPPGKSLADARNEARSVLGKAADGEDPAQDKRDQLKGELFRDLASAYIEIAEKRHRSWREEKRIIDKDLLPVLGFRRLVDIRRRDIRELVEDIARKRDAPIMANRLLARISRLFSYAIERDWIDLEFIRDFTVGFEQVAEYCREWTLSRTAEVTGVPERALMQAAEWWGWATTSSSVPRPGSGTRRRRSVGSRPRASGTCGRRTRGVSRDRA